MLRNGPSVSFGTNVPWNTRLNDFLFVEGFDDYVITKMITMEWV